MLTLVLGGSASGKSEYAEQLVLEAGAGPRFYIATMEPYDEECLRRISRHRAMRASKGFETRECPRGLAGVALPRPGVALLECMSNLVANEMFSPQGAGEQALAAILAGVERLEAQASQLIVVSNDLGADGAGQYDGGTRRYLAVLGQVNRALACRAQAVCEVVCGIPLYHKGGRG